MKKICSNNHILKNARPEDSICPECGHPLGEFHEPEPQDSAGMNIDNSIYQGDYTSVGEQHNGNEMNIHGDSAGTINKGTVITNTGNTTTNTNTTNNVTHNTTIIQAAENEGDKLVKCEYSGFEVPRRETFICNVCNRRMHKDYYIREYRCCKSCRDHMERMAAQAIAAVSPKPTPQSVVATQQPRPSVSFPSADNSRRNGDISKYILVGAVMVAVAGGIYMIQRNSNKTEISAAQTEQPAVTSSGSMNKPVSVPANKPQSVSKPVAAASAAQQTPKAASAPSQAVSAPSAPEQASPAAEKRELSAAELLSQGISASRRFNPEQAAVYFRQAIDKGSVEANYYLGDLYYNGNGVAKNFAAARSCFEKAAEAGMADAQYMIGVMYRNGQGCEKNIETARAWLQKAAAQGHAKAGQMLR